MSDEQEYQAIRKAARMKLDGAIGEYATTMNAAHGDPDIMGIVGAWVLGLYTPTTEEGRDCYLVESAINQPWHVSVGMAAYMQEHYSSRGAE